MIRTETIEVTKAQYMGKLEEILRGYRPVTGETTVIMIHPYLGGFHMPIPQSPVIMYTTKELVVAEQLVRQAGQLMLRPEGFTPKLMLSIHVSVGSDEEIERGREDPRIFFHENPMLAVALQKVNEAKARGVEEIRV